MPANPPHCFQRVCRYGAALRAGEMKLIVGDPERPIGWVEPDRVIDSAEDSDRTRSKYRNLRFSGLEIKVIYRVDTHDAVPSYGLICN